jgi:hypothetical protein
MQGLPHRAVRRARAVLHSLFRCAAPSHGGPRFRQGGIAWLRARPLVGRSFAPHRVSFLPRLSVLDEEDEGERKVGFLGTGNALPLGGEAGGKAIGGYVMVKGKHARAGTGAGNTRALSRSKSITLIQCMPAIFTARIWLGRNTPPAAD